jgi:hypothetical protein
MTFARETIIILWNVIILIWKFENKHQDILQIMEQALQGPFHIGTLKAQ